MNTDSNLNALGGKALVLTELKKHNEALEYYNKALELDSTNNGLKKSKEIVLKNIKTEEYLSIVEELKLAYKNKDYHKVFSLSEKAIELELILHFSSYLYKGLALYDIDKYKEAIEWYDKALTIDPNNVDVKQNKEIAKKELKKQKYSEIIDELLICYQGGDDDHKVITLSDEAIKLYPQHSEPYLYKGNILVKSKKFEDAVECYYKAMLLNIGDSVLWIQNDNMIYENLKHYKKSLNKNNNNLNYILEQVSKKTLLLSLEGHSGDITSVAISPDNTKIVSSGSKDKTIKVWDIATGELLNTLDGHSGDIRR